MTAIDRAAEALNARDDAMDHFLRMRLCHCCAAGCDCGCVEDCEWPPHRAILGGAS